MTAHRLRKYTRPTKSSCERLCGILRFYDSNANKASKSHKNHQF